MKNSSISVEQSNAFVETFEVPPTGTGVLDGLCFAVKDLIDVAGRKTGNGNPTWLATHPPAAVHAVCVEQLLHAGGLCVGKVITDQIAFSLLGQNHFYGTPLNPRAPDRVPGGSSSGSASAVACGLVDFALGSDTGGSVRVPASNCGTWGLRPSHGFISLAGVNPLAPTFDTVGILAASAEILWRSAQALLAFPTASAQKPQTVYILRDAFDLADAEVKQALSEPIQKLRDRFGARVRELTLREITGDDADASFSTWLDAYCVLQWAEMKSGLGAWIADAKPDFGPTILAALEVTNTLDRRRIGAAVQRREQYYRRLLHLLGPHDLVCIPTAPALAPLKHEPPTRSASGTGYYPRTLSLTSLAGIGRLPQVSMPLGEYQGVPVGLSLLAAHGNDGFLLDVVKSVA